MVPWQRHLRHIKTVCAANLVPIMATEESRVLEKNVNEK